MSAVSPGDWKNSPSNSTFLGHPIGLFILFFTEMWERFSYYGTRGLLMLYMVNHLFITVRQTRQGREHDGSGNPDDVLGWGFIRSIMPSLSPERLEQCIADKVPFLTGSNPEMAAEAVQSLARETCGVGPAASVIFGGYSGLTYLAAVIGGLLADRYLGQKKAVYLGAIAMALGQLVLVGDSNLFFIGLLLLIIGNGLFKPSIGTQVGSLYPPGDSRRDGAFTLFYMGIVLGVAFCNAVCGTLAAIYGWRYGFLAAGIGMCIGLLMQFLGRDYLAPDTGGARAAAKQPLTSNEWKRVWALVALCLLSAVFWSVLEQYSLRLLTWADERPVWPPWVSSSWFQSSKSGFVFAFAPLLAGFWAWQHKRGTEPFSVAKMAIGCFILILSSILMVLGGLLGDDGDSRLWPLFCASMVVLGELFLIPAGVSLVTRVAPARTASLMMGVWLLSGFVGHVLVGYVGMFSVRSRVEIFLPLILALGTASSVAIWLFNKPLRRMVRQPERPPEAAPAVASTAS